MHFYTSQREKIEIAKTPLGRGGEGNVYEVIHSSNYQGYVVKIYHPEGRTEERARKITYMIANRPVLSDIRDAIWPEKIVYEKNKFVGFLMRKTKSLVDLTSLCSLHTPHKLGDPWRDRFNRNTRYGLKNRVKVCSNIANILQQIHATAKYTLADIKPENIKVDLNGSVSLIDVDSVEIREGKDILFPAEKTTSEYSPAEWKKVHSKGEVLQESWDCFSMTVVFYKVLFGLHPFTGTCAEPYDKLESNDQKILHGLFPHSSKETFFRVIPEPHQSFFSITKEIQHLFLQCFEEGHKKPSMRPTAKTWLLTLNQVTHFEPTVYHSRLSPAVNFQKKNYIPREKRSSFILMSILVLLMSVSASVYLSSYRVKKDEKKIKSILQYKKKRNRKELEEKYGFVETFKDGLAKVKQQGKYGFINKEGKRAIQFKYDWADNFSEGMARARVNQKYGFVDKNGKEIIPLKYDWVGPFHEGLAKIVINKKTGYINQQNQEIILPRYEYGGDFTNGFAKVKKGGKWGFINQQGHELIPPQYDNCLNFYDGLAAVKKDRKWGYINASGKQIIPLKYRWVSSFVNQMAMVKIEDKEYYIDTTGKILSRRY